MIVIIICIGAVILDNFATNIVSSSSTITGCNNTAGVGCPVNVAHNVTILGLGGMTTFGNWINIIVIMVVVGSIIGLIYGVFRFVGGGAGQTAY